MKKFLKVLGAAALIAGFTPYHAETDEETGERKLKALLWQASKKPGVNGEKDTINVEFLSFGKNKEDETHLFTDDLEVAYTGRDDGAEAPEEPSEAAEPEEAAEPAEAEEAAEPEMPAEPAEPQA